MTEAERLVWIDKAKAGNNGEEWLQVVQATVWNLARVTESQLRVILEEALKRSV